MANNKLSKRARQIYGKIGGKIGGPARADALTAARRREIAKLGAAARWGINGKPR